MKKYFKYIFLLLILVEIIVATYYITMHFKLNKAVTEFKSELSNLIKNGNCSFSYNLINDNTEEKREEFNKDGKILYKYVYIDKNDSSKNEDKIYYYDGKLTTYIDKINKIVEYREDDIFGKEKLTNSPISEINSYFAGGDYNFGDINTVIGEFEGKKCYIISFGDELSDCVYLDYKTYEIIGMKRTVGRNFGESDIYTCKYNIDNVKESDFELPDTTGYDVK